MSDIWGYQRLKINDSPFAEISALEHWETVCSFERNFLAYCDLYLVVGVGVGCFELDFEFGFLYGVL